MRFEETLARIAGTAVLILGDVMLDEYIWGEVRRISPEAPVPIVEAQRHTFAPGGAANVAANVVSLGGVALLGGLVGEDEGAKRLKQILEEQGVNPCGLTPDPLRPTTRKTRILAHSQQVARVDSERRSPLPTEQEERLLLWAEQNLPHVGACVLSDYSKGVITASSAQKFIALAKKHNSPVLIDPKGTDYAKYRGATLITPNLNELELATGIDAHNEENLLRASQKLGEILPETALLVTRGAQGMSLFLPHQEPTHIPTLARHVYDVTGAGDTVVSTLALLLATGADTLTSAHLANAAAGVVVGKVGTARVTCAELQENLP